MIRSLLKNLFNKLGYEIGPAEALKKSNDPVEVLQRLLGKEKVRVIVDGGASIGDTSENFCNCFPKATVHAFEPYPSFQKIIAQKSLKNNRIQLAPFALSDRKSDALMYVNESEGTNSLLKADTQGMSSVYGDLLKEKGTLPVQTTSLDDWMENAEIAYLDILKLDIQGFEIEAIRGARETLRDGRVKSILCEVMFRKCYERQTEWGELVNEIMRCGFVLFNFFETQYVNGQLCQADGLFLHESIIKSALKQGQMHFHSYSNILID